MRKEIIKILNDIHKIIKESLQFILLLNALVDDDKRRKKEVTLFKVGFEKAHDSVD